MIRNIIFRFLRKLLSAYTSITLIALFAFSGFLSCVSMPSVVLDTAFPRVDTKPPIDAFGLVITDHEISPDKCLPSENFDICQEAIKSLPIINQSGLGSGLLVKSKTRAVFLTAAHVCLQESPNIHESHGVRISLKKTTKIKLRISTGNSISAKIIKIDEKNDLCALEPETVFTKPIEWGEREPEVGDTVYAISAPHGINSPTMNLIFTGFYSGHIEGIHHYTIPTRPGSSGSIVLNKNFRGVGMLNAAYIRMESIGIGSGFKAVRSFLDSI